MLQAAGGSPGRRREATREATASLAAANKTGVDAAVAACFIRTGWCFFFFTLKRRIKSGAEGWKRCLCFTPRLALERVWLNTLGLRHASNVDRKPRAFATWFYWPQKINKLMNE